MHSTVRSNAQHYRASILLEEAHHGRSTALKSIHGLMFGATKASLELLGRRQTVEMLYRLADDCASELEMEDWQTHVQQEPVEAEAPRWWRRFTCKRYW